MAPPFAGGMRPAPVANIFATFPDNDLLQFIEKMEGQPPKALTGAFGGISSEVALGEAKTEATTRGILRAPAITDPLSQGVAQEVQRTPTISLDPVQAPPAEAAVTPSSNMDAFIADTIEKRTVAFEPAHARKEWEPAAPEGETAVGALMRQGREWTFGDPHAAGGWTEPKWRQLLAGDQQQPTTAPPTDLELLEPTGEVTPDGRPIHATTTGEPASELSITVSDPRINEGLWTNIPSLYDGKVVSDKEAIQRVVNAGGVDSLTRRPLPGYTSRADAVAAAEDRSKKLGLGIDVAAPTGDLDALIRDTLESRQHWREGADVPTGDIDKLITDTLESRRYWQGDDTWPQLMRRVIENTPEPYQIAIAGVMKFWAENIPINNPDLKKITTAFENLPPDERTPERFAELVELHPTAIKATALYRSAVAELRANQPNVKDSLVKKYAYDIATAVIQNTLPAVASVLTKTPIPSLLDIGARSFGSKYAEARVDRTVAEARQDAGFAALFEAIPEYIPLRMLIKPGLPFLKRIKFVMIAEGVQEMFTEALHTGYEKGVLEEDMTWKEVRQRLIDAGIVGVGAGGVITGLVEPIRPRPRREVAPEEAEDLAEEPVEELVEEPAAMMEPVAREADPIAVQTGSETTQRTITAQSYPSAVAQVEQVIGRPVTSILDYGAGPGQGTDRLRADGRSVDSYEPRTGKWMGQTSPTFTRNDQTTKKYDLVMGMNVLNVLEPDHRNQALDDIVSRIDEGGSAVIGSRAWTGDVANITTKTPTGEAKAVWVPGKQDEAPTYERGFDRNELVNYVKARLPEGYSVEKIAGAGPTGAIIRRMEDVGKAVPDEIRAQTRAYRGRRHVGFVKPKATGVTPAKPIRREDVLRPLFKALGVPLYQGRAREFRKKGLQGFFRLKGWEEVRIRKMNDIEVAAHEMAHLLDDRIPAISKVWETNKDIKDELLEVSYDDQKVYEGFAEFVRLWATQKEQARSAAPKFYGWFEDFVARSKYGPALSEAQKGFHAWFAQDPLSRLKSKIGDVKPVNDVSAAWWTRFRQTTVDDLAAIRDLEVKLHGAPLEDGPYQQARMSRATLAITEGALNIGRLHKQKDGSWTFAGKGLREILKPIFDSREQDNFVAYAVARSSSELMEQGRERLFTQAEIDAGLALETPMFRKAFGEYQIWNSSIVDFAQDKGIIDPGARKLWKRSQYLPYWRTTMAKGDDRTVPGPFRGIRALTGGTGNLRDIYDNMQGNAQMLIEAAVKNEAALDLVKMVEGKLKGRNEFLNEIQPDNELVTATKKDVTSRILKALGIADRKKLTTTQQKDVDGIIRTTGSIVPLTGARMPGGPQVLAVLEKGKPRYFEVGDPFLWRSIQAFNRPVKTSWFRTVLGTAKRLGQATITLSIDFATANLLRDAAAGWVFSRHGFTPGVDTIKGMASRLKKDPAYKEFLANGGGHASYLVDESAVRKSLSNWYDKKGINYKNVLNTPGKWLLAMEKLVEVTELSTRLGEYKRARAAGVPAPRAAFAAREVAVDFQMRGDNETLNWMYDSVIFLKAAAVGLDRAMRGIIPPVTKAMAASSDAAIHRHKIQTRVALLSMASIGLYLLNRGNPCYEDLPDYDKDLHWHFFIPTPTSVRGMYGERPSKKETNCRDWTHFRYPKPWEPGMIATMADSAVKGFLDGMPAEVATAWQRIFITTFKMEYVPQLFSPWLEVFGNRSRYFDVPLESMSDMRMPESLRKGRAPRWLRGLGATMYEWAGGPKSIEKKKWYADISPAKADAILRGYFHYFYTYGSMVADSFYDETPGLRLDQIPGVKRIYKDPRGGRSRWVDLFYEALNASLETAAVAKDLDRQGRKEYAREHAESPAGRRYYYLRNANERLGKLRKVTQLLYEAKTLKEIRDVADRLRRAMDKKYLPEADFDRLQDDKFWGNRDKLKRGLLDAVNDYRSQYLKDVMQTLEVVEKKRKD